MSEYDMLISWPIMNPSGFWAGVILPFLLAAIAFGYSTKVIKNEYSCARLLLIGFVAGLIVLAVHELWLWPAGIYGYGNLSYGNVVVIVILAPYMIRFLRWYKLNPPDPLEALWMTWLILFCTDVVTGILQPGGISKFTAIGAGGFSDGLFILPLMAAAGSFVLNAVFNKSHKCESA